MKPALLRIPNEIVLLIAASLPLENRAAFLRTNKQLYNLCSADFYRTALREDGGTSALRYAARTGNTHVAALFLERLGVSPDHRFRDGLVTATTCLHVAAKRGHVDLVKLLLSAGALVDARNEARRTPLHHAAHGGALEVAKVLVASGADIMARDEVDATPLHAAAKKGHHLVCEFLLEAGALVEAMCKDPQNEVDDGYTPLHGAADFGHAEVAKCLLAAGAKVDAKIEASEWTPLGCAAAEGHVEVVKCLLLAGAEVNVVPEVPLRLAVDGKWHEGVLGMLLDAGADVPKALEGLFHVDTATRLTEFAEKWKSGALNKDEKEKEAAAVGVDADTDAEGDTPMPEAALPVPLRIGVPQTA
ncbi:ankyrin repeat-containing domain protein [Sphaerosporella brunnea]|uniref:Ankyrin repeat-containing domain protein n=1 Tax=Sphaerosporella brunnea TaxID=1250544 RepID=A0A5J5EM32_9PEZI|nr:ankyrin repeat-containing domain protein [Sphaerosporella brunnea]